MPRRLHTRLIATATLIAAFASCTDPMIGARDATTPLDAASIDASADTATDSAIASPDADAGCFVSTVGVWGQCLSTSQCASLGPYVSTPGFCPGPADIECCTRAPNVADNPPVPVGWQLMSQSSVTPAMTSWAVMILHDPTTYPMFSTTTQMFGSLPMMARVEWHPPDFQNSAVHRGVTLYQPI